MADGEILLADHTGGVDPAALAAAGYRGVFRYLKYLPNPYAITAAEAAATRAAGLELILNWEENGQSDVTANGGANGTAHARYANAQADAVGYEPWKPIYFSVDYDAPLSDWPTIANYFRYAGAASARPVDAYAKGALLVYLVAQGVIPSRGQWEPEAWYQGQIVACAGFFQRVTPTRWPADGTIDENVVVNGFPWPPPWTRPTPNPAQPFKRKAVPYGHR